MQDFYSVSTVYVTKTPPLANAQTGRGKYVSSIEEAARVVCDLRRSGIFQPIAVKLEKANTSLQKRWNFKKISSALPSKRQAATQTTFALAAAKN
ncbi:MAG: hypothetical protein IJ317_02750 [Clostridia bacterium]|nr:hypothetical protein [Clostridia bacterium]